jgi:hypothetical protein
VQHTRRVARGIDGDAEETCLSEIAVALQLSAQIGHMLRDQRAEVRAVGIDEAGDPDPAGQLIARERGAVLIDQRELGDAPVHRQVVSQLGLPLSCPQQEEKNQGQGNRYRNQ